MKKKKQNNKADYNNKLQALIKKTASKSNLNVRTNN